MSSRATYRRHSSLFKIQVCQEIRSGGLVRRGAQEKYNLSANVIQHWLALYDRGELVSEEAEGAVLVEYQAKIAALERKVGQLTMELDLLKKTPSPRLVTEELGRRGHVVNHKRVARVMEAYGLGITPRRRFVRTTLGDERLGQMICAIFGRLKTELFYPGSWRSTTIEQFMAALDSYIRWYNEQRIKISLGSRSPLEYRASLECII